MSKERELLRQALDLLNKAHWQILGGDDTGWNENDSARLTRDIEAYLLKKTEDPVAYVNGTFGGRITIRLLNQALVIPDGMALYAKR